jgi:hypothetical protein
MQPAATPPRAAEAPPVPDRVDDPHRLRIPAAATPPPAKADDDTKT